MAIYGKIKAFDNARNRLVRKKNEIRNNIRLPEEKKAELIAKINDRIAIILKKANMVMYQAGVR